MYLPDIKAACVVRHPRFGLGKVVVRYGEDENSKVIVKFQEEGEKKLALRFANLEVDTPVEEPVVEEEAVIKVKDLGLEKIGVVDEIPAIKDDEEDEDEEEDDEDEEEK